MVDEDDGCPDGTKQLFSSMWPGTRLGYHLYSVLYEDVITSEEYYRRYGGDSEKAPLSWPVYAVSEVEMFGQTRGDHIFCGKP
jgi:hypothetical protein